MIVKVKHDEIFKGVDIDEMAGEYKLNIDRDVKEGKVTLAIRKGKKRKLVSGTLRSVPCDDLNHDLYWKLFFRPNNQDKMRTCLQ